MIAEQDRLIELLDASEQETIEARAEVARLRHILAGVLASFHERGHPGRPCVRSGWVHVETFEGWHQEARR